MYIIENGIEIHLENAHIYIMHVDMYRVDSYSSFYHHSIKCWYITWYTVFPQIATMAAIISSICMWLQFKGTYDSTAYWYYSIGTYGLPVITAESWSCAKNCYCVSEDKAISLHCHTGSLPATTNNSCHYQQHFHCQQVDQD